MTVTGFILSGAFSSLPKAAEEMSLAVDFAKALLIDNEVSEIEVADRGSLKDRMQQFNNNEADAFVLLASDAAFSKGSFAASDFCVSGNFRFVSKSGDFLGAVVNVPMEYEELTALESVRVTDGEKITPRNFACITRQRKESVFKSMCASNVYVENIESTLVSPLSKIGSGSFIGSGVRISGESRIGKNCTLSGACSVSSSRIGDSCTVQSAVIVDSLIGDNVNIGPFAYVRPGCKVADGVKVGDFVELKNSCIGAGTKISHLTYVGDSDVGGGVNFGCGTVTVNYDGIHKHRTVIGDNAFIGCNTNLVAPVKVGDNAFIAAGSTITDEIPDKSFAIARQKQTTKQDYVTQKMPDMIKNKK